MFYYVNSLFLITVLVLEGVVKVNVCHNVIVLIRGCTVSVGDCGMCFFSSL